MMDFTRFIRYFILFFNFFCMIYTLILSMIYFMQLIFSYFRVRKDNKRNPLSDHEDYVDSENLLPVSLLIPAYNEQENIVENIHALMEIDYPTYELIVVNDGSTDSTHEKVVAAFELKKIEYAVKVSIPAGEIKNIYYNPRYPKLIYVDKANGGKADSLNVGINVSVYPLFVCLDADSRIEKDAIIRLSTQFIKDTKTVVSGGFVRIANGSVVRNGVWESFKLPEKAVERFQIVEYFRAFLAGRVSWNLSNSLLIVSGAFGVFNKNVVIECGGYRTNTIGEDMEIIVRIHKFMRKNKRPYTVTFDQNAICWTQGPMSLGDLRSQRKRWQVGLMDSLFTHGDMFLNHRYGATGMLSVPYAWFFEFLGAPIEVLGYLVIPLSYFLGELSLYYFILYLAVATCLGIAISLGGLILEQTANKGCISAKQCMQLAFYAFIENFGYRQLITLFRMEAVLNYRNLKGTWGKIKRKEFNR